MFCFILLTGGAGYCEDRPGGEENLFTASSTTETARMLCEVPADENLKTGRRFLYLAPGNLYPPYAADPFRVGFGIESVRVSKPGIADSSRNRVNLRAGGQLSFVRFQPIDQPDLGWELTLIGGFNDQNDVRHSLDNIGWDGHYGLLATAVPLHGLAFKFGLLHVSSHVGDEFLERTGRLRIGYTRQEVAAGASWFFSERWRLYTETGRAFFMGNRDLQEPWRAQVGLEYESAPKLWNRRMSWYAAVDSQSMQERDWRVDVAVQAGVVVRSAGRTWRIGLQWYNGRPPISEFFQSTEQYMSFGLWIDI